MKENQKKISVTVMYGTVSPEECLKNILQIQYTSITSDFLLHENTGPEKQSGGAGNE